MVSIVFVTSSAISVAPAAFPESMQMDDITERLGEPWKIIAECHGITIWDPVGHLGIPSGVIYTRKQGEIYIAQEAA